MSAYLLDANHLSPLVTLDHPLRIKVIERLEAGDRFAVATPALHEFLFGIAPAPRADKNWREWEYLSPSFTYYQIDHDDARAQPDCGWTYNGAADNWELSIR
jgi:predicted nucleic acid-binding protein